MKDQHPNIYAGRSVSGITVLKQRLYDKDKRENMRKGQKLVMETTPPRLTVKLQVKTAIHHLKWIHYLTAAHTHAEKHTHTQAHSRLVSGGGVFYDSNISLRDKSERELDFLLLGVRTAGHIYLHKGPVLCVVYGSGCVCVCVQVCVIEKDRKLVSGHGRWGWMALR